jgi:16S rRNA (adenine1518-N6/adenine1519-N6)-dimethyltransferase
MEEHHDAEWSEPEAPARVTVNPSLARRAQTAEITATSRGQTLSALRKQFQEWKLQPRNKLGQNFLIDLNLLDFLIKEAELTAEDLAIEVGSGTGSLTTRLAQQAGAVFSVEIDGDFFQLASRNVGDNDRVLLVHADILRGKNHLNPRVLEQLEQHRGKWNCPRLKLVANLPFAVATPVICNFLLTELPFERMVVTVQQEIGERLIAVPGTRDYGALAVLVQSVAEVELLRRLPPTVFWPRPKVSSAIVRIRPDASKRARVGDVQALRIFLRDLYSHRRKNLRGALAAFPSRRLDKPFVDAKLSDLGLDGSVRAETLDLEQHLRLCRVFGLSGATEAN